MLVAIRCNQTQCIKFVAQWHSSLCESHPNQMPRMAKIGTLAAQRALRACPEFSKADGWLLCHMSLIVFVFLCVQVSTDSDPWWIWWQFHVHIVSILPMAYRLEVWRGSTFWLRKDLSVATIGRARGAMKTMDNGCNWCNGCFLHVGTLAAQTNCDWQQHAFSTFQDRTGFVRASPVRETARWR